MKKIIQFPEVDHDTTLVEYLEPLGSLLSILEDTGKEEEHNGEKFKVYRIPMPETLSSDDYPPELTYLANMGVKILIPLDDNNPTEGTLVFSQDYGEGIVGQIGNIIRRIVGRKLFFRIYLDENKRILKLESLGGSDLTVFEG